MINRKANRPWHSWEIEPATNGYKYVGYVVRGEYREVSAYSDDIKSIGYYMDWLCSDLNDSGGHS